MGPQGDRGLTRRSWAYGGEWVFLEIRQRIPIRIATGRLVEVVKVAAFTPVRQCVPIPVQIGRGLHVGQKRVDRAGPAASRERVSPLTTIILHYAPPSAPWHANTVSQRVTVRQLQR
jgi:hypothetical protein